MLLMTKKTDDALISDPKDKAAVVELIGELRAKKQGDVQPIDPSAGLILTQGHYLLHLVYWFILCFVVKFRDEESFTCLK
jgi:hypothetical protein